MVHEKYIKRGDKVFGPYLYENYREKGVVKTRYLGVGKRKNNEKKLKHSKILLFGAIFLVVLFLVFLTLFFLGNNLLLKEGNALEGEFFTNNFFDILNSLLSGTDLQKGDLATEEVNVFVSVIGNALPEIGEIQDEILVCENKQLSYFFNVTDPTGTSGLTVRISDIDPFFIRLEREIDSITGEYEIFSWWDLSNRRIIKEYISNKRSDNEGWATYPETITADNGESADSAEVNITIIEINNPPIFDIGTNTIDLYVKGDANSFYYNLGAYLSYNLEETPTENLTFNLVFLSGTPFFSINNQGVINVTGNQSFILPGGNSTTYWINISVYDKGLQTLAHHNISLCLPDDNESRQWSDDFFLTVTKQNRNPVITSYYPLNLSLIINGAENLYFNISARDPDWNLVDVYWYVDDVEKEYLEALDENNLSKFEYAFGCGISGNHTVKVIATDGLLNDSVHWNLSVKYTECQTPQPPSGGGGGGGGGVGKLYCEEKWGCEDWIQCQNLNELVKSGWTSKETELLVKDRCKIFNYVGDFCGFQTRMCTDFNYCGTSYDKPGYLRECYFTENPNCTDKIKNCHDRACEVLVDCGGPCSACPTCSDNTQNQNEERVDCGGVCKPCIEIPFKPALFKSIVSYSLIALLIIILVLVIEQVIKHTKLKRLSKEDVKYKIKKSEKINVFTILFFIFLVIFLLLFSNMLITNLAEQGKTLLESGEKGILASYSLVNSFLRTLGIFLTGGPIISNEKLTIFDDSNDIGEMEKYTYCERYCVEKHKSVGSWEVNFYANYTDLSDQPISQSFGGCKIRFENLAGGYGDWHGMEYDSFSQLWKNTTSFRYKGSYNFEVNCSTGSSSLNVSDDLSILNTIPYISQTAGGFIDFDANGFGDTLKCVEDVVCYYNFSANVSEDDLNDILTFSYILSGNTTLTNFELNSSTGILKVSINHSSFTGDDKRIELGVQDSMSTLYSAVLRVDIQNINDAPVFVNLTDKTFNALDLFEYEIYVADEENNVPFKFNVSFVSCSNLATRGNCTLFTQYFVDNTAGRMNISFVPSMNDVGFYIINFSVIDNSSLGNKITSQLVNFTVNTPIWRTPLVLDYNLTENQEFYLNLSESVISEDINFLNNSGFYSFSLASDGIIDFTPIDEDVGYHEVEIVASDSQTISPKIFNFTVLNINDKPSIGSLQVTGASITLLNITAFENANVKIYLFIRDDDFLIQQKEFYDESLILNLTIQGANTSILKFVFDSVNGNQAMYTAGFVTRGPDVGSYDITVNITDKSNSSDVLRFNMVVLNRDYNSPVINYPDENYEFKLKENVTSNLIFMANHTVGDNLTYIFYINGELRDSLNYYGNNRNLTWQFTPKFTDETYNETKNLTLLVLNPYFPEMNASRTWSLTINHTNAPVELIREIGDKSTTYNNRINVDLSMNFYDVDYYDPHYNQSVEFIVTSNSTPTNIGYILLNWSALLTSLKSSPFSELLNITAHDLNDSGGNMSQITSNNFFIEFTEPPVVSVLTPSSGGGGGGSSETVISLKLIFPGSISAYEYEKIEIPISLFNNGKNSFSELTLSSFALKDGNVTKEVNTSIDRSYFKSLDPGQREDLNLTVFFDTDKIGDYEVLINLTSKSPKYTDWGKIHINLQRLNDSQIRELIVFTHEFIVTNPQCIELKEIVEEAEKLFLQGDYATARIKSEQAIDACKESIAQPSIPKKKTGAFGISLYLILAVLLAFVLGVAYYFFKRRKIQKIKTLQSLQGDIKKQENEASEA